MSTPNTASYDTELSPPFGGDDGVDLDGDEHRPTLSLNLSAFTGSVAADRLSRRVKALACTAPLHALESSKARVAEGRWTQ